MYLRQLRYFVAIVETGSFSKAAQSLRIAQPALSLHLKNMEADFGVALLLRSPQGVRPTIAGEILLRDAKRIIQQFEETRRKVKELKRSDLQGPVRVGISSLLSKVVGGGLIQECRRRYPLIDLHLSEATSGAVLDWLNEDRIDFGLLYGPIEGTRYNWVRIFSEPVVLIASAASFDGDRRFPTGTRVSYDQVSDLPLVLPTQGQTFRDAIDQWLAIRFIALRPTIEINSVAAIFSLVKLGVGYSLLPISAVTDEIRSASLRAWRVGEPELLTSIHVVEPVFSRPRSDVQEAFIALSCSVLRQDEDDRAA